MPCITIAFCLCGFSLQQVKTTVLAEASHHGVQSIDQSSVRRFCLLVCFARALYRVQGFQAWHALSTGNHLFHCQAAKTFQITFSSSSK